MITVQLHLLEGWLIPRISVTDRHRVEADPDPDPTFRFNADPYPDLDPTPSYKQIFFNFSYSSTYPSALYYHSHRRQMCPNFQYFEEFIELF